jgi:hypothetical protein
MDYAPAARVISTADVRSFGALRLPQDDTLAEVAGDIAILPGVVLSSRPEFWHRKARRSKTLL